jgi:integrase/recombinase XerD
VVISDNGRLKPDCVIVEGKSERHPEGAYYLEWYVGSKRVHRSVGKDAVTTAARRHQQEQILASKAAGIKLADEEIGNRTPLGDAAAIYLEEIKKTKKRKTYSA